VYAKARIVDLVKKKKDFICSFVWIENRVCVHKRPCQNQ
jgi:hypothetical protein